MTQFSAKPGQFSPSEVEFQAEDELIEIIPNFRLDTLYMIQGEFGPFRPQIPTTVPIWLAVLLKKRGKCSIQLPEWMSAAEMTNVIEKERDDAKVFQPVPYHYIEISQILFDCALNDIPDSYKVRALVEDLREVRHGKIQDGLKSIETRQSAAKLNHLSAMEVNMIRPFFTQALASFYRLGERDVEPASQASQRTGAGTGPAPQQRVLRRPR